VTVAVYRCGQAPKIGKQRVSKKRFQPDPSIEFDLKTAIERIQGVLSAGIVFDGQGNVTEIHLVSSPSRSPKSLVRDTESLLCAQFNIRIDYRAISVVQLGDDDRQPFPRRRLRLVAADAKETDGSQTAHVVLRTDEGTFQAITPVTATTGEAQASAAGRATLVAAQGALGVSFPIVLRDMQLVAAEGGRICLAVIDVRTPYGAEHLTGSCVVGENLYEAASKAALDAINRRLGFWARFRAVT
jgi:hypothetical protein